MSGEVDFAAVNGLARRVYDSKVKDLRPREAVLQRMIKFDGEHKLGESFQVSVSLRPPNGFTYSGSAGGVGALNAPRNMVNKQISIVGHELNLREQMSYKAISALQGQGEAAVKSSLAEVESSMQMSTANRVEGCLLHGQRGYGTVESVADLTGNIANIVITAETWAPGLWWAFGENSTWDAFTTTTKNNASGVLIVQPGGITTSTRTIKVAFTGTLASEITAGDLIFPSGANAGSSVFNEMLGLCGAAGAITGTVHGLDTATYSNWKGNTKAINGPPSHAAVEDCIADLRDRGAKGALTVFCSSKAYAQLVVELSQLRRLDDSYSTEKGKQGMKGVAYFSPEVGEVAVVYHPFMKQGEMLILPVEDCDRVGSSDVSMGIPGMGAGDFLQYVPGYNAVEFQSYTDQAVVLKRPNHSMLVTGLTYVS